jgi:hypothetical protein
MVARDGNRQEAFKLYIDAFLRGCYGPGLSVLVLLQVCLNAAQYRRLVDATVGWLHLGPRAAQEAPLRSLKEA